MASAAGPPQSSAWMKTGPCSSYAPGCAPVASLQRRSGAYETSAIRSPGSTERRQQRSGDPTAASSVAVNATQGRPASSVSRSSLRAAGAMGCAVYVVMYSRLVPRARDHRRKTDIALSASLVEG